MGEEPTSAKPLSRRRKLIQGAVSVAIATAVVWVAAGAVETPHAVGLVFVSIFLVATIVYDLISIAMYYYLKTDKYSYELEIRYGMEGVSGDLIPVKSRLFFIYPFVVVVLFLLLSHATQLNDPNSASNKKEAAKALPLQPQQ